MVDNVYTINSEGDHEDDAEQKVAKFMVDMERKIDAINRIVYNYYTKLGKKQPYIYGIVRTTHSYKIVQYLYPEEQLSAECIAHNPYIENARICRIASICNEQFHINIPNSYIVYGAQSSTQARRNIEDFLDELIREETEYYGGLHE